MQSGSFTGAPCVPLSQLQLFHIFILYLSFATENTPRAVQYLTISGMAGWWWGRAAHACARFTWTWVEQKFKVTDWIKKVKTIILIAGILTPGEGQTLQCWWAFVQSGTVRQTLESVTISGSPIFFCKNLTSIRGLKKYSPNPAALLLHGLETSLKAQTWGGSRPFLPFLQDLVITLLLVEGKRASFRARLIKVPNCYPSKYFPPHILLLPQ